MPQRQRRRFLRDPAGRLQHTRTRWAAGAGSLCELICRCDEQPATSASGAFDLKQECVKQGLLAVDDAAGGMCPIKAEIPYNMTTDPPTPILTRQRPGYLRATRYLPSRMKELGLLPAHRNGGMYQVRIPDAVVTSTPEDSSAEALTAPNLNSVARRSAARSAFMSTPVE